MLDSSGGNTTDFEAKPAANQSHSPAVRLGTLLPGSVSIGTGTNRARKGFVWLPEGKQIAAIVKAVNSKALAAEVFCAVLGRESDMNIPEPLLVKDPAVERL